MPQSFSAAPVTSAPAEVFGTPATILSQWFMGINIRFASAWATASAMAGVIVITTKRGTKGRATVGYTGEFTTRMKPRYRDYNIMNSQEIMGVYKEMADKGWLQIDNIVNAQNTGVYGYMYQQLRKYDPTTGTFGLQNTEAARNAYLQQAEFRNTDWFDMLFSSSISQTHSVSISSGTEKSQSYFSMSLMHDPGYFVNRSKVNRYTFNGNTSYDILKNLTVKLAAQGSHRTQEAPGSLNQTTDVVTGEVKRDFDINPFSYAMNTSRCLDPNINYTRFYTGFNIFNDAPSWNTSPYAPSRSPDSCRHVCRTPSDSTT